MFGYLRFNSRLANPHRQYQSLGLRIGNLWPDCFPFSWISRLQSAFLTSSLQQQLAPWLQLKFLKMILTSRFHIKSNRSSPHVFPTHQVLASGTYLNRNRRPSLPYHSQGWPISYERTSRITAYFRNCSPMQGKTIWADKAGPLQHTPHDRYSTLEVFKKLVDAKPDFVNENMGFGKFPLVQVLERSFDTSRGLPAV